jgi:glutamate dehydrogenase
LAAPERAVVLAYSKMWLYDEMLASDLPDDPWVATALARYFPPQAREKLGAYFGQHPLRREIIATHVVNSAMNRVGGTFVHRLLEATGAPAPQVVRAYLLAREIFGLVPTWQAIEALDNRVADAAQADMLLALLELTTRATTWFLRSPRLNQDMAATIATFQPATEAMQATLPNLLDGEAASAIAARDTRYREAGVPGPLARRVAAAEPSFAALDIIEIATAAKETPDTVAEVHFELERRLSLAWLRERIATLPVEGHWQGLAKAAMADDVSVLQRSLAQQIFADGRAGEAAAQRLAEWETRHRVALARARAVLAELRKAGSPDAAMLSVLLRELRTLI